VAVSISALWRRVERQYQEKKDYGGDFHILAAAADFDRLCRFTGFMSFVAMPGQSSILCKSKLIIAGQGVMPQRMLVGMQGGGRYDSADI